MTRRRHGPLAETVLVLLLAWALILAALLPSGFALDRPPGPDLIYCLAAAWVIRRPGEAPLWAILAIGLGGDILLSRPVGLGALGLLVVTEALRANAAGLRSGPFLLEWLVVAGAFALMTLGLNLALLLAFAAGSGAMRLAAHALVTALAYPALVALLALGFGMRAHRSGRAPDRLGRIP